MPFVPTTISSAGSFPVPAGTVVVGLPSGAPVPSPYPATSASIVQSCAPLGGTPLDVLAALTDGGRVLIARGILEGLGFKIIGFRVGRGGYDPNNPLNPTALVATNTELIDPFYPVLALPPAAIARFEPPNDEGMSMLCRVPAADAIAGLGEIGIYAEITVSPVTPAEVGDIHLFVHVHRPLIGKTLQDVLVNRVVVQY